MKPMYNQYPGYYNHSFIYNARTNFGMKTGDFGRFQNYSVDPINLLSNERFKT